MKHGQKAKGKAAKAKASKKSSSTAGKKIKASQTSRPKDRGTAANAGRGRPGAESVSFNNPVIAAAFRRAVKKYPNAFRRLTD